VPASDSEFQQAQDAMSAVHRTNRSWLVALGAVVLGVTWSAGYGAAQGANTLKKDYISPAKGRFSGAVVVHGTASRPSTCPGTPAAATIGRRRPSRPRGRGKDLAAVGATPEDMPASTMVGVQSLISPQNRIEVEAVAMIKE
jgi:hypothetical protein